jgi:tRNA-Thr(GGU) m(6)t(6)A37 methyltransferase TsaA
VRELVVRPIGHMRSPHAERVDAPRQPRAAEGTHGVIELLPGLGFEDAVADLEGFSHIWVIAWFDRNTSWRPKVTPPRSDRKRGVLATRSPHRPNPLALSVLALERVDGLSLHVRDVDLLDGTPILDVKPYIPWADAIPSARPGWLEGPIAIGERPEDVRPAWDVVLDQVADAQLALLDARGIDTRKRTMEALALGPMPHAYRRIKKTSDGYTLAVKRMRVDFTASGQTIHVHRVRMAAAMEELGEAGSEALRAALDALFTDGRVAG